MSAPDPRLSAPPTDATNSTLIRAAMWVAIGALIAAAVVCVIWVLIGSQNDLIGRAFLTILLLAAFAGATMLDAKLAPRRPAWFALASMVVWVATMLIGAFLIWMPQDEFSFFDDSFGRLASFLLIALILQLALLHIWLVTRAITRRSTALTRPIAYIAMGLVVLLAVMLVVPLMLREWVDFHDLYWRLVVAVTILAAVGTALVPLMNALFAPRRPRVALQQPQAPQGWPTYVDGVTPLPVMPDGSPDWNAYYTGYPSAPPAPPQQPSAQQQWQSGSQPQQWPASYPPAPPQWAPQPPPVPATQWGAQGQSGSPAYDAPLPPAAPAQQWAAPPQQAEAQEPPAPAPQAPQQPNAVPPAPGHEGSPPPPPPPPR